MADLITETKVVQVRLVNSAGDGRTISLDNPRSSINLNRIKQAFAELLDANLLLGNSGTPLTQIDGATIAESKKIKLGDSPIEITVTPSTFTFAPAQNPQVQFNVTGSNVIGGYFTDLDGGPGVAVNSVQVEKINNTSIQATINFTNIPNSVSGNFNIVTEARTIAVPIQLQV